MLGTRDHDIFEPVDNSLKAAYIDLVNNLVNDSGACFTFDDSAHSLINDYRNWIEKQMGDNGRFNDSMIRGTMGKAGEHQIDGAKKAIGHAYGGGSQFFAMWLVSSTKP